VGLREDIFGVNDRKTATVHVPEWNMTVSIQAFSGAERDSWEQTMLASQKTGKPIDNFRAKLTALVVVDEQGNRVFSDSDVDALGKKSAKALDRIFEAFMELNKLTNEDVKELEKKS
jgi:hypothetical protein